jgi:metal-responsive CopG/Arc/MetJ family transcriptional regulator
LRLGKYVILTYMKPTRRTYSLPSDLLKRFEGRLLSGERSRFLAKLIDAWLTEQERAELRTQVIEGCVEMSGLYRDIDREWTKAAEEVWRDLA